MPERLSPEPSSLIEAQDLPQKLLEIVADMNNVFDQEMHRNPNQLKVSYLKTSTESTRIQWFKNLASIGFPENEQVYEIRRELSPYLFRTNQKVLTIYVKPDSEPKGELAIIRGETNGKGELQDALYTPATITENEIKEFKGVLSQKLNHLRPHCTRSGFDKASSLPLH